MQRHRAARKAEIDRIHVVSPANPLAADLKQLGFASAAQYVGFVRAELADGLRLTCSPRLMRAVETPLRGGRRDDDLRVRDLQGALDDPHTAAIIATNGGAYLSRLLPRLDFTALARRRQRPLIVMGFSEITGLVNLAGAQRGGLGVYWLCPNYLAWKVRPAASGRTAFAAFWRELPATLAALNGRTTGSTPQLWSPDEPLCGELVAGRAASGPVRLIGGCLSVLAAMLAGPLGRRLRPEGRWLAIEDVNEAPYRIDRYLAALQLAGWFERLAGVIVGDFHSREAPDLRRAVVELLAFHVPRSRRMPIVLTRDFGHVWPMKPLPIGPELALAVRGRRVRLALTPLGPSR